MRRIGLVVTGNMENAALPASLAAVFPTAEFCVVRKVDGFTGSRPLREPDARPSASADVEVFAQTLLTALEAPKRRRDPKLDFVVGVDDLELTNQDRPDIVAGHLSGALHRQIGQRSRPDQTRAYEGLRQRCSFHLFKPMPEAYFFGDKSALDRAGKLPTKLNHFDAGACDVEAFLVEDDAYLSPSDLPAHDHSHWRRPHRAAHPKQYLMFLSDPEVPPDDPTVAMSRGQTWAYRETRQGKAALEHLDWESVLRNPEHAQFARALFTDIADMLGVVDPFPGRCHTVTWSRAHKRLLRNL